MAILYPPILERSAPAFVADSYPYEIKFSWPIIQGEAKHIEIKIAERNGKLIGNTNVFPDGIIYKNLSSSEKTSVIISRSDLETGFEAGKLYKIQLRIGSNEYAVSNENLFYKWKEEQFGFVSEWSTTMVVKAIAAPTVEIINSQTDSFETTTTPIFYGSCSMPEVNNEIVDKNKFDLYDADDNFIETSGWQVHNGAYEGFRFKTRLTNDSFYIVRYSILTVNGYETTSTPYRFQVAQTSLGKIDYLKLEIDAEGENGCIQIKLTSEKDGVGYPVIGTFVITRASEKDNYLVWEDIKYIRFSNELLKETVVLSDYTIESGVKYKYAIQQENKALLRSDPIYEDGNQSHSVYFEYAYLCGRGKQIKLKFDNKISSFKKTVLANKQDTIGSRYPTILRNGMAYYAEFPLSGLIAFDMDVDCNTFFTREENKYYYDDELVFSIDELDRKGNEVVVDSILSKERAVQVYLEQAFRNKVESFLNDGEYKLYRSATEGNILVALMNVSLAPKEQLGRMIYSFNATAYEIDEASLENLNANNVIDIGKNQETGITSDETTLMFGQISGYYIGKKDQNKDGAVIENAQPADLMALIEKACEQAIGSEGYLYKMIENGLRTISVELYPKIDLSKQLSVIAAKKAEESSDKTEEYQRLAAEEEYLLALQASLNLPENRVVYLQIDGQPAAIGKGKSYNLQNQSKTVKELGVYYSAPLVINFTYEAALFVDDKTIIKAIEDKQTWNQLAGVFTDSPRVLSNYDYLYLEEKSYKIENNEDGILQRKYEVYSSLNLLDVIKEQMRLELAGPSYVLNPATGNYKDVEKNKTYIYSGLSAIDIEAEAGTKLRINNRVVIIGPTCHYSLDPALELLDTIEFIEPTYAIVNYVGNAQIRTGGGEEEEMP